MRRSVLKECSCQSVSCRLSLLFSWDCFCGPVLSGLVCEFLSGERVFCLDDTTLFSLRYAYLLIFARSPPNREGADKQKVCFVYQGFKTRRFRSRKKPHESNELLWQLISICVFIYSHHIYLAELPIRLAGRQLKRNRAFLGQRKHGV